MKAWVLHQINDIRLENVKEPVPAPGEVLVEVKAAGICGSDIPRIYKTGAHTFPLITGHEFSGQVVKCPDKTENDWLGKRVGIFPLIPCGDCAPCKKEQYEMCRNYSYLGSRRDGGFAEYVSVPVRNLIELPENVSYEEAAMLEPMAVAAHAMRRTAPKSTDTVAVCGLGTIGMLLLMFLSEAFKSSGKDTDKLLVIGNKAFQKQIALGMGIREENYCDSKTQDVNKWLMDKTKGLGADVFFECVGKSETFAQGIDCAAAAGKVMLVGNPYSDMSLGQDTYWKILRNQLMLLGTWNSSFTHKPDDDWRYVIERLEQKKIEPAGLITHRLTIEEMEKGFHIMRDKTEDYVKIMMCR